MAEAATGNCRGMRWALIGSVTLNLLVVGVVVGGIVGHDRHPPRPVVGDVTLGAFTEALSKEDRNALLKAAQTRGSAFRDMRRQSRADMALLIDALEADPWERDVVKQILMRHQARTVERVKIGDTLIFERLEAMPAEQRQKFAERLRHNGERRARFEDRRKTGDRPPAPSSE